MNFSVLLCVLAVLAAGSTSVVRAPVTRANLNLGYIGAGDRLLYRQSLYKAPIANAVQYQDFIYRGAYATRITAIQAYEVGYTQFASAYLTAGGIGRNNTSIRVQSARGYGYNYVIDIWGR